MTTGLVRFLHLSDFHVGKDGWAQQRLFEKIVQHVTTRVASGLAPDLVFLTGDIANRGLKSEYQAFRTDFFEPLQRALGGPAWSGRILSVPGNHDVARPQPDVLDRIAATKPGSHFFDPTRSGRTARDQVAPRFKQYRQLMPSNVSSSWLTSNEGAYSELIPVNGASVRVIGLNTAWLSMNDNDRGFLSPGVQLAETALQRAPSASVTIVLGHHPLHWLREEETNRLRALFGNQGVVYLHGHMHKPDGRLEDGAGMGFLAFQAGAAFHARDDEIWTNGITWGEIDLQTNQIRLQPRFWSADNHDWPIETGRFPERLRPNGGEWWVWPLPKTAQRTTPVEPHWSPPSGWRVLERALATPCSATIDATEAARFFDGAEPDWLIANEPKLQPLHYVDDITDRLSSQTSPERPQVTLLLGPGGEGKSTALRQSLIRTMAARSSVNVLWRQDESASISAEQILSLPRTDAGWIVASDSADTIARPLHDAVRQLSAAGLGHVQVIVASRDSDWRASGATQLDWRPISDLKEVLFSGLRESDANIIAQNWAGFGAIGLGHAAVHPSGSLGRILTAAARSEATSQEGALLGAMLAVRIGPDLRGHVKSLLERLAAIKISTGDSLASAFAYIAAMHAESLSFLSREVLSKQLSLTPSALQREVVFPLAREAAAGGGSILLTRHRRIAVAALDILRTEYGEDVDELYVTLAGAAKSARLDGWIPDIQRWEFGLAQHFFEANPSLSVRIARRMLEVKPTDLHITVSLARLYRESGDPESGSELLASWTSPNAPDRSYWFEWGTCAGTSGRLGLNARLVAWALADQPLLSAPTADAVKTFAAGLGLTFKHLYARYPIPEFARARAAAARLGLAARPDPKTRSYLEGHLQEAGEAADAAATISQSIELLARGFVSAWREDPSGAAELERIPEPQAMRFSGLESLLIRMNAAR